MSLHGDIHPSELAQRLRAGENLALLDVRQEDEHQFAALPGARLIPLPELMARVGEIEAWKQRECVVYCHHGMRSAMAANRLRQAGFTNVRNLAGGIDRWALEVDPAMPRY